VFSEETVRFSKGDADTTAIAPKRRGSAGCILKKNKLSKIMAKECNAGQQEKSEREKNEDDPDDLKSRVTKVHLEVHINLYLDLQQNFKMKRQRGIQHVCRKFHEYAPTLTVVPLLISNDQMRLVEWPSKWLLLKLAT